MNTGDILIVHETKEEADKAWMDRLKRAGVDLSVKLSQMQADRAYWNRDKILKEAVVMGLAICVNLLLDWIPSLRTNQLRFWTRLLVALATYALVNVAVHLCWKRKSKSTINDAG